MGEKAESKKEVPLLTVRIHPASSRLRVAGLVCFGLVFFAWGISKLFGGPLWGIAGGLLLFFSLSNFFFATVYNFYEKEFRVKNFWGTRKFKYDRFRSIRKATNGIFLSPYPVPTRLDSIRGIFLLMDKDQVQEVVNLLQGKIAGVPREGSSDG
ncbi:MAG: hypothetical protein J7M18_06005 [Candidatus Eremiobacteraeota bacterium]|nr:hypothetical protein [Candidatus Eremiobacteraeota bacterium]